MELILVLSGVMALFGFGLFATYKSDPAGWQRTFKRLSTASRAALESKSATKLELLGTEDWEASFEGKELVPVEVNHKLVKTWHENRRFYDGKFCNWKCKCGQTGYSVSDFSGSISLWFAERRALRDAKRHIKRAIKLDAKSASGGGDFAF